MELTIQELSAYLPYGLKIKVIDTSFYKYDIMTLCDKGGLSNIGLSYIIDNPKDFKPILRPLSEFGDSDDLKKVHEFIGLGKWCEHYDFYFACWFNDLSNVDKLVLQAPYEVFQYFLANHYDVFGLISNNLAIDINTLK